MVGVTYAICNSLHVSLYSCTPLSFNHFIVSQRMNLALAIVTTPCLVYVSLGSLILNEIIFVVCIVGLFLPGIFIKLVLTKISAQFN